MEITKELSDSITAAVLRAARDNPIVTTWMTPAEAAQYLRLKVRALEVMRHQGRGPTFYRVNCKLVRYRREDLDRFLLESGRSETQL